MSKMPEMWFSQSDAEFATYFSKNHEANSSLSESSNSSRCFNKFSKSRAHQSDCPLEKYFSFTKWKSRKSSPHPPNQMLPSVRPWEALHAPPTVKTNFSSLCSSFSCSFRVSLPSKQAVEHSALQDSIFSPDL